MMITQHYYRGNVIAWYDLRINPVIDSIAEHFLPNLNNTYIDCNYGVNDRPKDCLKKIFYDLEHKYPINAQGQPYINSDWWNKHFLNQMNTYDYDEIWCFQLENYEYYKYWGLQDKFRFVPLRYTISLEQYQQNKSYDQREYDSCFIGLMYANGDYVRDNIMSKIHLSRTPEDELSMVTGLVTNINAKMGIINNSKTTLDIPRVSPETINSVRIFESLNVGTPVTCIFPTDSTIVNYFPDDVYKLSGFDLDISPDDIINFIKQKLPVGNEVSQRYKALTYSDQDYDKYRKSLVSEYESKTGTKLPEYILDLG